MVSSSIFDTDLVIHPSQHGFAVKVLFCLLQCIVWVLAKESPEDVTAELGESPAFGIVQPEHRNDCGLVASPALFGREFGDGFVFFRFRPAREPALERAEVREPVIAARLR